MSYIFTLSLPTVCDVYEVWETLTVQRRLLYYKLYFGYPTLCNVDDIKDK